MNIINQNKDALFAIFTHLSSYKRSKVGTVCTLWNDMGLQCISLIENEGDPCVHGYYHKAVRSVLALKMYAHLMVYVLRYDTLPLCFIKLCYNCNGKKPFWGTSSIDGMVYEGAQRIFLWVREHNDNRHVSDAYIEEKAFEMGCKVGNPDLITRHNIPAQHILWLQIRRYGASDAVIGRILECMSDITIYDVLKGLIDGNNTYTDDLLTRVVNLVRRDVQSYTGQHAPCSLRVNDEFMNICRDQDTAAITIAHGAYPIVAHCRGIIESKYNIGIIKALYLVSQWRYTALLRMAHYFRDKQMAERVLDCIVSACTELDSDMDNVD